MCNILNAILELYSLVFQFVFPSILVLFVESAFPNGSVGGRLPKGHWPKVVSKKYLLQNLNASYYNLEWEKHGLE